MSQLCTPEQRARCWRFPWSFHDRRLELETEALRAGESD